MIKAFLDICDFFKSWIIYKKTMKQSTAMCKFILKVAEI